MVNKIFIVASLTILLVSIFFVSAGIFDGLITGKATTTTFTQNISSTGTVPTIPAVWNVSITDVSSGPTEDSATFVIINFTASDNGGYTALNDATATVAFNLTGAATRSNTSCARYAQSGTNANYTCNITIWWFDAPGTWSINASISNNNNNYAQNVSQNFILGSTAGFESSPSSLSWSVIAPGATNQEPSNHILANNTGNIARAMQINATDLLGETNSSQGLYATNFSAKISAGCEGTAMVVNTFTTVASATLPLGNYTITNGTAQEELYVCLEAANTDLSAQYYSTAARGAWTVKIIA